MVYVVNYSIAGDVLSIVICILCWLFLKSSYANKQQNNFKVFHLVNRTLLIASIENIIYHSLLNNLKHEYVFWVYVLNNSVYISLALVFFLYLVYLANLFEIRPISKKITYASTLPIFAIFAIYKLIAPFYNWGFRIDENLVVHYNYYNSAFAYYYVYFSISLLVFIRMFRNRLIPRIVRCLYSVIGLSFSVMAITFFIKTSTFTCVSFSFPILASLFFFHYNAYDAKTGVLDFRSFHNYIQDIKDQPYAVFCLYLKDFIIYHNKELSRLLVHFTEDHFTDFCTFRISDNKIFLVYRDKKSLEDTKLIDTVKNNFHKLYKKYGIPYKLIHISSNPILQNGDDIIELHSTINDRLPYNKFHKCNDADIDKLCKIRLIDDILYDIGEKHDLNDSRVRVYCQPIFDVTTGTYRSAEALMRLKVDDTTFYPNDFIPVAEKHGYMHMLSMIMLNKVCLQIKEMTDNGYVFDKISINISTMEFNDSHFCEEVLEIIRNTQVDSNKLAIEITESNDDAQYTQIKKTITELNKVGIRFYLDDFGTGYSNFQRIFELPLDLIKFDRSVTILSGENEKLYYTIKNLANIFINAGYKILYEGVETTEDESRCKNMSASYLQGYIYSKPIKIDKLQNYFTRKDI